MKILVFSHRLDVGGAQINAIELAEAMRDRHGCEIVLFATPGPLLTVVNEKRLQFRAAPTIGAGPSIAMARALADIVRRERPDVLHVWEWWQYLMSYYLLNLVRRIPVVITDMGSDDVPRLLPKSLHTTFGTPEFVDIGRRAGRHRASLLLPPVDVSRNAPGAVDGRAFRDRYGIDVDDVVVVTVSRLDNTMKFDSLRRTIESVRSLGHNLSVRLFIVGEGEARPELERLAASTNLELRRTAVVLTGELLDPRLAYAAADVVVGMGGSALRGMAFEKSVVVVGQGGYAVPFGPQTAETFYHHGLYGVGDGNPENTAMIESLSTLCADPEMRRRIGRFGREFVLKHFSLERVSGVLASYYRAAAAHRPSRRVAVLDGARSAGILLARPLVPAALRRVIKERERANTSYREAGYPVDRGNLNI